MTFQGGDFDEEAHDEAKQPPQGPQPHPFGQDFIPPAYAGQPPARPEPNAPRYPPQSGPVPPWDPSPSEYPAPSQPPPSQPPPGGYGPPGYPGPPPYGGPGYPPPPPQPLQYDPSYPPPGYRGGGYGGPPVYPGPYDPYNPYQSRSHETNSLAIASLVSSIAGVPLSLFCWIGFLIPVVGVVLGAVALSQIKRTGQQGRGLAIAGIAVGAVTAVLVVLFVIAVMTRVTSPPFS